MTLEENSFAVLGVSPTDERRILTEKADEAALLGGGDVDEALNQLMQMNRRIPAELSWFPGSARETAEAFLAYARQSGNGHPVRLPGIEGLGTVLAQANALDAFFRIWPADDPLYFTGMCRSIDSILSQIQPEDVLEAVNADRAAGKWEPVPGIEELEEPLSVRLRELCQPAVIAAEKLNAEKLAPALVELFDAFGLSLQGELAQALMKVYELKIHDQAEAKKSEIIKKTEQLSSSPQISENDLEFLEEKGNDWCSMTTPLRKAPGAVRNDARLIGFAIRHVIVDFFNKAPAKSAMKSFTIYQIASNKRVTITYKTKRDDIFKTLKYLDWLLSAFPEQTELLEKLREDKRQLNNQLKEEDAMLAKAEFDARNKRG